MRRKRNIPTCVTFFHRESEVPKHSVLNVKISFQVFLGIYFVTGSPTEPVYCRFGIEAGRSEAL